MFFIFLISCLSTTHRETREEVDENGITYRLNKTTGIATIIRSKCPTEDKTLQISGDINIDTFPYKVDTIEEEAFFGCEHLVGDLTIPDSITFIGYKAFANCGFTGSLTFNAPVDIDASLFSGSDKWTGSLTIGNKVPSIGDRAFEGLFLNGKSLSIGSGVKSIGSMAFYGCKFSTSETITIPSNVEKVGGQFLAYVTGSKNLDLQATIPVLSQISMLGLESFETLKISHTKALGENCLMGYKNFKTITVENCEKFLNFAFANTSFDQDLVISSEVIEIKQGAFAFSSWSGSLTINAKVDEIDPSVFSGARFGGSKLTITNVKSIGARAFENCFTNVVTVSLGTIEKFGSMAFYGCKLDIIIIPSQTSQIGRAAFHGAKANELSLDTNLDATNSTWFEGKNEINRLILGSKITKITNSTFSYCSNYKGGLTIKGSLTAIEDKAFYHCSGFSGSFTIPETVKSIGESSFSFATGFDGDLIINADVSTIDSTMFSESGFKGSLTIGNYVTEIGSRAFELISSFKGNLTIGSNVQKIGSMAFYGTEFTGSLVIPDKVTIIESHAFMNSKFDTIKIMSNNLNVSQKAFHGMSSLTTVTYCGYNEIKCQDSIFDDTLEGIQAPSFYLFDTVCGRPRKSVLCSACNVQYEGHTCVDPTASLTKAPPPTQSESPSASPKETQYVPTLAPTKAPTKAPTQSPTKAPTQSPTQAPSQGSTVVVPSGKEVTISDEKVSKVVLEGDAIVNIQTSSDINISPSAGNHQKTTLTLNVIKASKLKITSFDDITVKLNSDAPVSFEDSTAVTIEASKPLSINQLNSHSTRKASTFKASGSEVTIKQVTLNGQDKTISFEGKSVIQDIQVNGNTKGTLNGAVISGKTNIDTNAELNLNNYDIRKTSNIDLHYNDFGSKTILKFKSTRATSLAQNFDPANVNVYFNNDKASGEVKIIEGIDEGKCSSILDRIKLPNTRFSASCDGGNVVVKASEDDNQNNDNTPSKGNNMLLIIVIAAVVVVFIIAIIVVVVIIMKKKGKKDDDRSLSENVGSSLQSPLLF